MVSMIKYSEIVKLSLPETWTHCFLVMFFDDRQTRKHCVPVLFPEGGQTRKRIVSW